MYELGLIYLMRGLTICMGDDWQGATDEMDLELHELTRRITGRPSPLKIESAQMSGHIHDFTDKI